MRVRSLFETRPRDAYRQRQKSAQRHDGAGLLEFGLDPRGTRHLGEQGDGTVGAEDVKQEVIRVQTRKRTPAGDNDPAGCRARNQRTHLFGIRRIVQDDEQPLAVERRTVQRRTHLMIISYLLARYPQTEEKRHQNRRRLGRRVGRGL